ncbi:transcriptional regulator [Kitasatospora sp. NPDC049285]|uniref:transcriptional regulator n=1 Tax=Kitasatospora sp. NPDC049285 TaxID=3157096 RepID=UPI003438CB19
MLTTVSGTLACPDADRPQRLAAQLTDMIPGAVTIRVSLTDPTRQWPHPHAIAKDAAGRPIELSRTTSRTAARWILRVWPQADWSLTHTLHLGTATLAGSSDRMLAGRGR